MASNVGWDKTVPSGTSSIAQGDDDIRSTKSILQAAWEDEHYFTDGSSASAGEHKLGSARVFMATAASQLSNPETGRLLHLATSNALYVASSSSWSQLLGVNESSRNTFTAQQNFHANAKIGVGGSALSVAAQGTHSLSLYTLAGSATTHFAFTNQPSADSTAVYAVSLKAPVNSRVVQSAYYDTDNDVVVCVLSNQSTVDCVLPAQTVRVAALMFA